MKKFRRKGQQAEKDKTERVTGLGRRTIEEIAKRNQVTALRFQTGGKTSDIPGERSMRSGEEKRCSLDSLTIFQLWAEKDIPRMLL